jgi:transcriptional regulator with XRE-family HTH domain
MSGIPLNVGSILLTMPVEELTTAEAISRNLTALLERHNMSQNQLAAASGVGQRTISDIVRLKSQPTAETLHRLAKPFKLQGWQLAMPNLPPELLDSDIIGKVIRDLVESNPEGRTLIVRTAEREARFSKLPAPRGKSST